MYLFPQPSIWILYMASNLSFLIIHESKEEKKQNNMMEWAAHSPKAVVQVWVRA